MSILAKSAGSAMPGRGLTNPAFVIKIVPATDDIQQGKWGGRPNQENDFLDDYKVGDKITAEIGKVEVTGNIIRIIKNDEGDGIFAVIKTQSGKTHKIEGSQIISSGYSTNKKDDGYLVSSPGVFNESRIMSFNEFNTMKNE